MATQHDVMMKLPVSYYRAIGEFLFRFAQLEYQLHEIAWFALGLDHKRGRVFTIGTDVKVLCGILNTITMKDIWIKDKFDNQEINSIANRVRNHSTFRNQLAHGSWQESNQQKPRLVFMKERDERYLPKYDASIDDALIQTKAGQLKNLNHRAKKLIDRLDALRSA